MAAQPDPRRARAQLVMHLVEVPDQLRIPPLLGGDHVLLSFGVCHGRHSLIDPATGVRRILPPHGDRRRARTPR
ncbi:hypothetical protein ACFQ3Z_26600 [Streptomyces nogalater]